MRLDLTDPTAATLAVARALDGIGIRSAVYGGLALAAYGEPRETKDADFAIAAVTTEIAQAALTDAGLAPSLRFERVRFGGNDITRFALLGSGGIEGFNVVDFVEPRSSRYAHAVLERSLRGAMHGQEIMIVSPEDFVLLKVLSTRERDLDDAASVVRALGPRLEIDLVEREASELARELPDHDAAGKWQAVRERAGRDW
jgi:hypothetical protein